MIPEALLHHVDWLETEIGQVEEQLISTTKAHMSQLLIRRNEMVRACKIIPSVRTKLSPPPPAIKVYTDPNPSKNGDYVLGFKSGPDSQEQLKGVKGRVLTILLSRQAAGLETNQSQLALIAGLSANSSHIGNIVSSLRSAGCIVGSSDSLQVVGLYQNGPKIKLNGSEIRATWIAKLGGVEGRALLTLLNVYPRTLTRDEVATELGLSLTSSHIGNVTSALRAQGLITGDHKALRARDEFFI